MGAATDVGALAGQGQLGRALHGALAGLGAPLAVLDCAGGSGSLAVPLAEDGAHVTVLDTSANALATLARRAAERRVAARVRGVQGELETLAEHVPAGAFDAVLLHDVLGLVDDPGALLRAATAALRPGGLVSLLAPNPAAAVVTRAGNGDVAGAEVALAGVRAGGSGATQLVALAAAAGLSVRRVSGIGAVSGWVDATAGRVGREQLAALDRAAAEVPALRDLAPSVHVLAVRDGTADGP